MTTIEMIRAACRDRGISPAKLERDLGYSNGYLNPQKAKDVSSARLFEIAEYLGVSAETLLYGETKKAPRIAEDFVTFPVIGDVAAGYDHIVNEDWTGDVIDIPRSYIHGRKPEEFFVLRVTGDSMYPLYMDGDLVLVLKQTTMNYSGEIGVVLYEDSIGTLKRIEYVAGEDWMRLVPVNPQFPPIMVRDEALEHCRVLGVPKMLIREVRP